MFTDNCGHTLLCHFYTIYCIQRIFNYILTDPRAYHGTAALGHDIYVIGGFDGVEYFNSVRCFNPVTKGWSEIAPMNVKR
jgi:kelch-like protein 10